MKIATEPGSVQDVTGVTEFSPADVARAQSVATRQRVIRSILKHGPSTAKDLATRLSLTPAAIRRHLVFLAEAGHLETRAQRVYGARGRGRPAMVYLLTDAGRDQFEQGYAELAIQLLEYVDEKVGPEAVLEFARRAMQTVVERFHATDPNDDSVERLASVLNEAGHVVSVLPSAHGRQLCQFHCPISHVSKVYPQLCLAETHVLSELLGTHVQKLATIASGAEVCTTHIPFLITEPTTERKPE